MARHMKVSEILEEADRAAYEELLRQPTTTVDSALNYLLERGYKVCRTAVWNHKKSFDQVLESVRRSAEMAKAFGEVAKEGDVQSLSDATVARFQQLLMSKLMDMEADEEGMEARDWKHLSEAVKNGVGAKAIVVRYLAEKFDQVMAEVAEKRADKKVSPEDVADARKRIFGC